MPLKKRVALAILTCLSGPMLAEAAGGGSVAEKIRVTANPARVCYLDRTPSYLNFDLIIENATQETIKVSELRGLVLDAAGEVVERRLIWAQSLELLGAGREIAPGRKGLIFNPFLFNSAVPPSSIRYELEFDGHRGTSSSVTVTPQRCVTRARLVLPLTGRVAILDGYDVYSHHRRMNYTGDAFVRLGIFDNFQRFGMDLVMVDTEARTFRTNGNQNTDYLGWEAPVRAAGAGVVVAMANDQVDNDTPGKENRWSGSLATVSGNYVLIDHGAGEFSLVAHLREGSVRVHTGDHVRAGDVVGLVGNSGSSLMPHTHYELRSGPGIRGIQTFPAYFFGVKLLGANQQPAGGGVALDTGDIVLSH